MGILVQYMYIHLWFNLEDYKYIQVGPVLGPSGKKDTQSFEEYSRKERKNVLIQNKKYLY